MRLFAKSDPFYQYCSLLRTAANSAEVSRRQCSSEHTARIAQNIPGILCALGVIRHYYQGLYHNPTAELARLSYQAYMQAQQLQLVELQQSKQALNLLIDRILSRHSLQQQLDLHAAQVILCLILGCVWGHHSLQPAQHISTKIGYAVIASAALIWGGLGAVSQYELRSRRAGMCIRHFLDDLEQSVEQQQWGRQACAL
jgi:hypothetical protein